MRVCRTWVPGHCPFFLPANDFVPLQAHPDVILVLILHMESVTHLGFGRMGEGYTLVQPVPPSVHLEAVA